MLELLIEGI